MSGDDELELVEEEEVAEEDDEVIQLPPDGVVTASPSETELTKLGEVP